MPVTRRAPAVAPPVPPGQRSGMRSSIFHITREDPSITCSNMSVLEISEI